MSLVYKDGPVDAEYFMGRSSALLMPEQNKIHAVEAKKKTKALFLIPEQKNPGVKSKKLISALDYTLAGTCSMF